MRDRCYPGYRMWHLKHPNVPNRREWLRVLRGRFLWIFRAPAYACRDFWSAFWLGRD